MLSNLNVHAGSSGLLIFTEDGELIGKISLTSLISTSTSATNDLNTTNNKFTNLAFGGDGNLYLTMSNGGVSRVRIKTKPVRIISKSKK